MFYNHYLLFIALKESIQNELEPKSGDGQRGQPAGTNLKAL